MNWDWDKLKEKQNNKQTWTPFNPKNDDYTSSSDDNEKKDDSKDRKEQTEFIDFRTLYKKKQNPSGNGNNGNGGNNGQNPFVGYPNAPKKIIRIVLGLAVLLWLLSGIYIVEPDEAGVVLRFGKYAYTTEAGPHYHLPYPIEQVYKPKVTQIRQAEVGFRSKSSNTNFQQGQIQNIGDESAMLTGDENIVNIQFSIQYRVIADGAVDYLFNVENPDAVLKNAAEAAMREVIGNNYIDAALTDGKIEIQNDVSALLQSILDKYQVGLEVVSVQMQDVQPPQEVSDAFKDVASAREDKIRIINESEAYRNELIPKARGDAAAIINNAEAYKQTRIRQAEGEASRFIAVLEQYQNNPDTTKKRLVYEALENILSKPGMEKIILSEGMQSVMPILPLTPGTNQTPPANITGTQIPQTSSTVQNYQSTSTQSQSRLMRPDPYNPTTTR